MDGRIWPEDEAVMRRHLIGCPDCTRYYNRLLIGARLDPKAPSAEERLARGMGRPMRRERRRVNWLPAMTAGATLAACALLLIVWWPHDRFAERGGKLGDKNDVLLYRTRAGVKAQRIGDRAHIHVDDELAFAYRNPESYARLVIFAVDEHKHIYWYYPAWNNAADDPVAVAIRPSPSPVELREVVAHELDGRLLRVHALFTNAPVTVKQIEQLVQSGRQHPWREARELTFDLQVDP
jgi:hypothetical protein